MREVGDGPDDGDDEAAADPEATPTAEASDPGESGAESGSADTDAADGGGEAADADGTEAADAGAEAADAEAAGESDAPDAADAVTDAAFAVPTETKSDRETAWRRDLAAAGELTPGVVDAVATIHGTRGTRAIEAVSEGRVKRYRDFTVVVGYADEYVVEDGGCTCKDSSYNLDTEDDDQRCWHVLAAAVAERIGELDHHDMWYSDVREFL
ncbi:hypothetical protein SAMN04487947_0388 [Halogeometricum rufum]|uniref:SWIM-type domain-containing protein n=1 Tax=Halogeometricum rufum TaxID=553469 RepID=A0A1I6G126_9EURY|nr:hypothetical protein SAMN04487947_0388 [Halogeometricum rufum]